MSECNMGPRESELNRKLEEMKVIRPAYHGNVFLGNLSKLVMKIFSGYFRKTHILLSVLEKIYVHTMNVFKNISVHTDTEKSLTKSFCSLNLLCKNKLVMSSFSKRYVFARPHDNMKTEFPKITTPDTVFEKLRFHHRKLRLHVNGRPKRINK